MRRHNHHTWWDVIIIPDEMSSSSYLMRCHHHTWWDVIIIPDERCHHHTWRDVIIIPDERCHHHTWWEMSSSYLMRCHHHTWCWSCSCMRARSGKSPGEIWCSRWISAKMFPRLLMRSFLRESLPNMDGMSFFKWLITYAWTCMSIIISYQTSLVNLWQHVLVAEMSLNSNIRLNHKLLLSPTVKELWTLVKIYQSYFTPVSLTHGLKGLDTCYSATYTSQTRDQQRFTISEVAADWHEPLVTQRMMWPSIARATDNWSHGAASRHTIAPISQTRPSPVAVSTTHFPSHWG